MNLYCLENARTEEQVSDMFALNAAGICVLCPTHLEQDPQQPIVRRSQHWIVTPNEYPYKGTKLHLLLVPREHAVDLLDLSPAAKLEFWQVLGWVRAQYSLTYYGIGARNGDCRFTGGSIAHVHVHLVVGDVADPEHVPVRLKLSSRPHEPQRQ